MTEHQKKRYQPPDRNSKPAEETPIEDQFFAQGPEPSADAEATSTDQETAQLKEQYLRLAADFENFKRRKAQELSDRAKYSSEDAAREFLPILDNLRRAVDHLPEDTVDANVVSGLHMVVQQFDSALQSLGIEKLETVGERFDPAWHEAIAAEESPDVTEETVIEELQPGYRLHDRLLRPARVRIAHPAHPAPVE